MAPNPKLNNESVMKPIEYGDCIEIHYTTNSLEGGVVESSSRRDPLRFTVGSDEVLAGLSRGVLGMRVGETKRISIPSEQAFGRRCDDLIQTVPRTLVPETVAVGDQLSVSIDGTILDVWVQKVTEQNVTLDANHPLAGESLVVDVEVLGGGFCADAGQEN